jgi:ATP-binding cassette subfamily F protein uup
MEALEKEQAEINASLADGSLFISDADKAMTLSNRLTEIDELLLEKLERWEELENLTK